MSELIQNQGGIIGAVLLIVVSFNVAITGIAAGMDKIAKATENKTDDKIAAALNKVASFLKGVADIVGANKEHK